MLPIHTSKVTVFNYDEIPPGYYYRAMLEGAPTQRFWHREKFKEVASRVPDGARLLDVGCGPGCFLSVLGDLMPQVEAVGIDVASKQIDFANENVASRFADGRIRFRRIDEGSSKIDFPDASFDCVTCIEVVEHIHPYFAFKMLDDIKRLLKPGGRLIITTPNYRSLWPFIERALEKVSAVKYHDQHINKFTPNSSVKFLESAGFKVDRLSTLFVAAPFLSSLSEPLSSLALGLEKRLPVHLGSLLIAEATIMRF